MSSITARIDAVTAIPDSHRRADPPVPKSVKIELTGRCNWKCQFCALRSAPSTTRTDMDFDFFKRITAEMLLAGGTEIGVFYPGEAFCAPDLLARAIRYLKRDLGMPYVFLTTNGSLATPERVDDVMEAGLDSLKWSVNAADPEQFERLMGVPPRLFERALDNLKWAREVRDVNRYPCRLYASSILYDGEQQIKMERLLTERVRPFVDEFYWLPLYKMSGVADDMEKRLGYRPTAGNQARIGALREPLPCWAVMTEGHVTSSGLLSACCFDADGRFAMADLNQIGFMEGWRSAKFAELREAHLRKDVHGTVCERCVAYV